MPAFYFDVGGVIIPNTPSARDVEHCVPETLSIIERLLQRGDKVGLATAFSRPWLDRVIELTPILRNTTICCSCEIGVTKPDRAFFAKAQQLIGSDDIVFVDDQPENVRAARAFGWTAILADDGWQERFTARYLRTAAIERN